MPFEPGNAGRPKGAKGRKRQMLESRSDELLEKLIDLALLGDATALRLCIDRLLPRLRAEAAPIKVDIASSKIAEIGTSIVAAAMSGKVSPDSARDIVSALADVAKLREHTELEERLRTLEQLREAPPWERNEPKREMLPLRGKRRRSE